MKLLEQINTMERLDQLIRLRATGNLEELACRLGVSKSTTIRNIEAMRTLGAPIVYNFRTQTYEYSYGVSFVFGFKEITNESLRTIEGGYSNFRKTIIY